MLVVVVKAALGRYADLVLASIQRLETERWVIGPRLEAERWRRQIREAARGRGWRIATGVGSTGYPWAARTDLENETATPWYRLGVSPRTLFSLNPPAD